MEKETLAAGSPALAIEGGQQEELYPDMAGVHTELAEGLVNVQIDTYFSLNPNHNTSVIRRRSIKPQDSAACADTTEAIHIELQCEERLSSSSPVNMNDVEDYYMHPEENLYVCRHCLKRFKLRLMVKVHQCQRTHCIKCQQLVINCNCHNDSSHPPSPSEDDNETEDTVSFAEEMDESMSRSPSPSQSRDEGIFSEENPPSKTESKPMSPNICIIEQVMRYRPEPIEPESETSPLAFVHEDTVSFAEEMDESMSRSSSPSQSRDEGIFSEENPPSKTESKPMSPNICIIEQVMRYRPVPIEPESETSPLAFVHEDTVSFADEMDESMSRSSSPSQSRDEGIFSKENPPSNTKSQPMSPKLCKIEQVMRYRPEPIEPDSETSPLAFVPVIVNTLSLAASSCVGIGTDSLTNNSKENIKPILSPLNKEEGDTQVQSCRSQSRTESLPSNYDIIDDQTTSSTISISSLARDALERYHEAMEDEECDGEDSGSDDSDGDPRQFSCQQCQQTFFSDDQLTEHTQSKHIPGLPGGLNQVQATETYKAPSVTSFLANNSCPYSRKDFKVNNESDISSIQSSEPMNSDLGDKDVEMLSLSVSVAVESASADESVHCGTCDLTFSDSSAYIEHCVSCYRVWSKPQKNIEKPQNGKTYKRKIPRKCMVIYSCIPGKTVIEVLDIISHDHNYCKKYSDALNHKNLDEVKSVETNNQGICNVNAKRLEESLNDPDTGIEPCNDDILTNMKCEIKSEPDNISDTSFDIEDNELDIKDISLIEDMPWGKSDSAMVFPQPIEVKVVKMESLADSALGTEAESGLEELVVGRRRRRRGRGRPWTVRKLRAAAIDPGLVRGGESAAIDPGPVRRAQLRQLTMLPAVPLTRCDALVRRRAPPPPPVFPCPLCLSPCGSRTARALHASAHQALLHHMLGVSGPPAEIISLHFVGRPPDHILPYCTPQREAEPATPQTTHTERETTSTSSYQ